MAKAIPEGYHTVTPYLVVRGAAKTMDFAKKAFGAELPFEPLKRPDGTSCTPSSRSAIPT